VVERVLKGLLFITLAKLFIKNGAMSHKDPATTFWLSPKQCGHA
jgi:hypothetical protein